MNVNSNATSGTLAHSLKPGTTYDFRIRAVSSTDVNSLYQENDADGNPVTVTTAATPGEPGFLRAQFPASGNDVPSGSIRLRWNTPSDGGSPITDYEYIEKRPGESFSDALEFGSTNAFDDFPDSILGFTYRVRAVNAIGPGPWSQPLLVARPPDAPTGLRAEFHTPTNGVPSGEIRLRWNAPSNTGGSPITDYEYSEKRPGRSFSDALKFRSTRTFEDFPDSILGFTYRVRAVNSVSPGAWSERLVVVRPGVRTVTLVLTPARINESGPGNNATLAATLSAVSSFPTTVTVSADPAAAVNLSGTTLRIPAGETDSSGSGITVTAVDNDVDAPDARVRISGTVTESDRTGPAAVTLTIVDDDGGAPPPPPPPPPGNNLATGAPVIVGTAQVGETLTAGAGDIADADGLTEVIYAWQWVRVESDDTEADIGGAASATYTPVEADVGRTLKVRASFTDDAGNPEALTSAATAAVTAASTDRRMHRIGLFPSAARRTESDGYQGFARIINRSAQAGEVRIEAFDNEGVAAVPVTLDIDAGETVHFNSGDLEEGNAAKGLSGGIGTGTGDWRLELASTLDLQVLAYIRATDRFVTSMHDVVPETDGTHRVVFFNPGSNNRQVSGLRLVNPGEAVAEVTIEGIDDNGLSPGETVTVEVPAGAARTVSARALESEEGRGEALRDLTGALGDGAGKWRLMVSADQPIEVMSLLVSPTGHLTNLSTVPDNAEPGEDGVTTLHRLPLVLGADDPQERQGFVRVINRSDEAGEVSIEALDDAGVAAGPVTLDIEAGETVNFDSDDLEEGNAAKGLSGGVGDGTGDWRLELASTLDLQVLGYIRTDDGFVTSMHDVAPETEGVHRVVFFNPGSNTSQVSRLRLVNLGAETATVTIEGLDGDGESPGEAVTVEVPAGAAEMLTAQELESGEGLSSALGDGAGKWRLKVSADAPIEVMSLLASPTGHLSNLSTVP